MTHHYDDTALVLWCLRHALGCITSDPAARDALVAEVGPHAPAQLELLLDPALDDLRSDT